MQILSTFGFENNKSKGLDFINGDVDIISKNIKLPHIGWNNLKILSKNRLTENVDSDDYFYFVHSFSFNAKENNNVLSTTDYAEINFTSIVTDNNNVYGTQFHPEKSQASGLKILNNFINI
jgi:glutamine amidotransferase